MTSSINCGHVLFQNLAGSVTHITIQAPQISPTQAAIAAQAAQAAVRVLVHKNEPGLGEGTAAVAATAAKLRPSSARDRSRSRCRSEADELVFEDIKIDRRVPETPQGALHGGSARLTPLRACPATPHVKH